MEDRSCTNCRWARLLKWMGALQCANGESEKCLEVVDEKVVCEEWENMDD